MKNINGTRLETFEEFINLANQSHEFDDVSHGGNGNTGENLKEEIAIKYANDNWDSIKEDMVKYATDASKRYV